MVEPVQVLLASNLPCDVSIILPVLTQDDLEAVQAFLRSLASIERIECVIVCSSLISKPEADLLSHQPGIVTLLQIHNQPPLVALYLNYGILHARGQYLALGEAAAKWSAEVLQQLLDKRVPDQILVAEALSRDALKLEQLYLSPPFNRGTVIFAAAILDEIGLFDPHLILQSYFLWDWLLRATEKNDTLSALSVVEEKYISRLEGLSHAVARHYMFSDRRYMLSKDTFASYDPFDAVVLQGSMQSIDEWDKIEKQIYKPFFDSYPHLNYQPLVLHNHVADVENAQALAEYDALLPRRPRAALIGTAYTAISREWTEALSSHLDALVVPYDILSTGEIDHWTISIVIFMQFSVAEKFHYLYQHCTTLTVTETLQRLPQAHVARLAECNDIILTNVQDPSRDLSHNDARLLSYTWHINYVDRRPLEVEGAVSVTCWGFEEPPTDIQNIQILKAESPLWAAKTLYRTIVLVPVGFFSTLLPQAENLLRALLYENQSIVVEWSAKHVWAIQENASKFLNSHLSHLQTTTGPNPHERSLQLVNLVLLAEIQHLVRASRTLPKGMRPPLEFMVFLNSPLLAGSEVYGMLLGLGLQHLGVKCQIVIPSRSAYYSNETEKGDSIDKWLIEHGMSKALRAPYGLEMTAFFKTPAQLKQEIRTFSNWLHLQPQSYLIASGGIAELLLMARPPYQLLIDAQMQAFGYPTRLLTGFIGQATGLICDSRWAMQQWRRFMPPPIRFVPTAIESHMFRFERSAKKPGPISIAIGGTISPRKRQWECLLATELLIEAGYKFDVHFYGYELQQYQTYIDRLKERAATPPLKGHVHFHGLVEMSEIIDENDLFMIGSINESMPQTLLYAMAGGLICVAAPAGGIGEVVIDRETGYLSEGYTAEDLAQALRTALDEQEHWAAISGRAQLFLREHFTEAYAVQQFLQTLREGASMHLAAGALIRAKVAGSYRTDYFRHLWQLPTAIIDGLALLLFGFARLSARAVVRILPASVQERLMSTYLSRYRRPLLQLTRGRWTSNRLEGD